MDIPDLPSRRSRDGSSASHWRLPQRPLTPTPSCRSRRKASEFVVRRSAMSRCWRRGKASLAVSEPGVGPRSGRSGRRCWVPPSGAPVEALRARRRVFNIDANHAGCRMGSLEGGECARFDEASAAGGRPEVEHDRRSRELGQADRLAGHHVGSAQRNRRIATRGAPAQCLSPAAATGRLRHGGYDNDRTCDQRERERWFEPSRPRRSHRRLLIRPRWTLVHADSFLARILLVRFQSLLSRWASWVHERSSAGLSRQRPLRSGRAARRRRCCRSTSRARWQPDSRATRPG